MATDAEVDAGNDSTAGADNDGGGDSAGTGAGGKDSNGHLGGLRNKIEGPTPNQSLAEYLNRAHVAPLVRKCHLQKETKVKKAGLVFKHRVLIGSNFLFSG